MTEVWATDELLDQTRAGVELWHPVPGTEGRYEVSNFGQVRSWAGPYGKRRAEPLILKACGNGDGYPCVIIYYPDGTIRGVSVHNLQAEAFIGPRPGPTTVWECGHVDDDRARNVLTNIRWVTRHVNQADRKRNGRPNAKLRECREANGVRHYRCTRCETWKPEVEFGRIRGKNAKVSACGILPECRPCTNARRTESRRRTAKAAA